MEVSSWLPLIIPRKRLYISASGGEIRLQSKRCVRFKMPRSQLKTYSKKKKISGVISEDHNLFFTYVQTPNMTDRYYLKYASFASDYRLPPLCKWGRYSSWTLRDTDS
jgi:hypothetical protein